MQWVCACAIWWEVEEVVATAAARRSSNSCHLIQLPGKHLQEAVTACISATTREYNFGYMYPRTRTAAVPS